MAWRLTAKKGGTVIRSGSSRKDILQDKAEVLREQGYTVSIYKVKGGKK